MKWNHGFSRVVTKKELLTTKRKKLSLITTILMVHIILKGVLFVVTYHPLLKSLSKTVSKNLYLLNMDETVRRVFTLGPMVSFRSSGKFNSYLFRAKLYPTGRVVGSFKCNKPRCLVCENDTERNTFTSTFTGKTYEINHKFDCGENCLLYLLTCKLCGIQYVRQTVADFCYRWKIIEMTVENIHIMISVYKNICMITMCLAVTIFYIRKLTILER